MLKGRLTGLTGLALAALMAVGMAGCGDDGKDGATGSTGPSGPSGPSGASGPAGPAYAPPVATVASAEAILATVTGVTTVSVSGSSTIQQKVAFRLADRAGKPLQGLTPSQIRLTSAKLLPPAASSGKSSKWKSYIYNSVNQATAEAGTAGTLVDNKNGTYTYTFAKNVNSGTGELAYDATRTHRVALQISGNAINNAAYTWQPSTGATTGIYSREIVDNDTCNACHDVLQFHGGNRRDTQYCVTCHNPDVIDPDTSNSVDMKVLIHKIHAGEELTNGYVIVGYQGTVYDYSDIEWTQDIRNCQTCHEESDTDTPEAGNWRKVQNTEACGTCHDNINFANPAGSPHEVVGPVTDADCSFCHGETSTLFGGALKPENAHKIPAQEAARYFEYQVVRVDGVKLDGTPGAVAGKVSPGEYALATIKVINPTTGTAYDINAQDVTNPFFTKPCVPATNCNPPPGPTSTQALTGSLAVDVAWNTGEFTNTGSGSATTTTGTPAQPTQIGFLANTVVSATVCVGGAGVGCPAQALGRPVANADGSFTKAALKPVPLAGVTGSGAAVIEGRPVVDTNPDAAVITYERVRVVSVGKPFAITDASAVARRQVVNTDKCNDCHYNLSIHGSGRTANTELCSTCHNPDITCRSAVGGVYPDGSTDFKRMIHGLHAGTYNECGHDFTEVVYPGRVNNCEGCHKSNTFYPVDATRVFATSINAGANRSVATDDINVTPNLSVCSNCHTGDIAVAHMKQNGASDTAVQQTDGTYTVGSIETCALCHGPGKSVDLRDMHKIDAFLYN